MMKKLLSTNFYNIKVENGIKYIDIRSFPTLYKYQPVSEYSLHNFEADEIWGTVPTAFNDPYDCAVCFTISKLNKEIMSSLTGQRLQNYIKLFNNSSKKEITKQIVHDIIENSELRKQYCVACFSIYNDSEIMWGHYADSAKGFCIAYDGKELKDAASSTSEEIFDTLKKFSWFNIDFSDMTYDDLSSIMPVIYQNGKINITNRLINAIQYILKAYDNICNGMSIVEANKSLLLDIKQNYYSDLNHNDSLFYSLMCSKGRDWKYEQEWRIWTYNANIISGNLDNPYMKIGDVKAKAVYLGERMPEYTRRIILEIARLKNIPVYQMKSVMHEHTYKLKPILISNT